MFLCTSHTQCPFKNIFKYIAFIFSITFKYSFCHCFLSGDERSALIANKFDISVLKPGARQDWAMKPNLNSDCVTQNQYSLFVTH